jgi:hypothetical protein
VENLELLKVIITDLEKNNISDDEIERFVDKWSTIKPSDNLPCPYCFLSHLTDSRLKPLNEDSDYEPVKCESCKHIFYVTVR